MPSDDSRDKNRFGRSFGAAGWLVDGWLGTRPLFALVGAGLGGFGGFMTIYYRVKQDTERRDG
jgi:F0F1-type ATP synthase assembly protein I